MMIRMYRTIKRIMALFLLLFCSYSTVFSQTNPEKIDYNLYSGQGVDLLLESSRKPIVLLQNFDGSILSSNLGISSIGGGKYRLTFDVSDSYEGATSLIIEYYSGTGIWALPKYTVLNFNVYASIITTLHDYKSVLVNNAPVVIDVVANDFTSHQPLVITDLSIVENGSAKITTDNRLSFTPKANFRGIAYVSYVVQNAKGISRKGNVSVCVLDPNQTPIRDTIRLSTTNDSKMPVLLPSDGMLISKSPTKGNATFIGSDVFEYEPDASAQGMDVFEVSSENGDIIRVVQINIISVPQDNGYVKDDKVFTTVNKSIEFDAFKNDLRSNGRVVGYSDELEYLGDGNFRFTPVNQFVGVKHFFYRVFNGFEYQNGDIIIYVNNFYPEGNDHYSFVTKQNSAFIINYQVPISGSGFATLSSPANGSLMALGGSQSFDYQCGVENGNNLVIYTPDQDFVGIDEFDIEYCIDESQCTEIKVIMTVLPADDCGCAGKDCIWPGDANADGKIYVDDLLDLGYHIGEVGNARPEGEAWIGQFGEDWNHQQSGSLVNPKYADGNGDGIVNPDDLALLDANYDRYHNLVAQEVLAVKEYPFYIIPHTTDVSQGDWLGLDIVLGDANHPVTDVHGISYTLNVAPGLMNSESVEVVFHDEVWFGYNSPTLNLDKVPEDGRIDIGTTRTTGITVSGDGLLQEVGFIIEEDVYGLRPENKVLAMNISVTNIVMTDINGQKYQLPNASTSINLHLDNQVVDSVNPIKLYPNPTSNQLNIEWKGEGNMTNLLLMDITGQVVQSISLDTRHHTLDVQGLSSGMYILQARNQSGTVQSQKVQIINKT